MPLLEGPEETVPSDSKVTRVSELGYFCTPSESHVEFTPLSRQIQQEFMSLLQYRSSKLTTSHAVVETPSVGMVEFEEQFGEGSTTERNLGEIAFPIITVVVSSAVAAVIALLVSRLSGHQQQVSRGDCSYHIMPITCTFGGSD